MKKLLAVLLCVGMLFAFGTEVFGANKGKLSLKGDTENLKRGSAFAVTVELNRNPGVTSLRVEAEFDKKVLTLVRVENRKILSGYNGEVKEDSVVLRWKKENNGRDMVTTGKLAVLYFRVREDAVYGDSKITLKMNEKLYDAQNAAGKAVPFETGDLEFQLPCPHEICQKEILQPVQFEQVGLVKETCVNCGEEKETEQLPQLLSEDGKTVAVLQAGEYRNKDEKSVKTEYLFGGPGFEEAKTMMGEDLIRAFTVSFTKNGRSYTPRGETALTLEPDVELPKDFVLYRMIQGGAEQVPYDSEDGKLLFLYREGTYALVNRTVADWEREEAEKPVTTTTLSAAQEDNDEERQRRQDLKWLLAGAGVFLFCGIGIVVLLTRKKPF